MPINLIIRNPLDRDAREFIGRANVSDAAARLQLNEFVRGVKQLGLWESMVCWPMRSTQNAGTGTTVFSLGGRGTFNGTLIDGPTWGANGITNSATGRITTSYFQPGGSEAHIFVGNSTNASALRVYGDTLTNANLKGIRVRDDNQFYGDGTFRAVAANLSNLGSFKMAAVLYNAPPTAFIYLNAAAPTSLSGNSMVPGENPLTMLNIFNGGQPYSGQAAFYGTITTALSAAQYLAFNSLYKSTLGTGLGLP